MPIFCDDDDVIINTIHTKMIQNNADDDDNDQELEEQLEIFPEKRGIKKLGSVLHCVQQV